MHEHKWSKVGLWETDKEAIYPCLDLDCTAALLKVPSQPNQTGQILPDRVPPIPYGFVDNETGGIVKIIWLEIMEHYKFNNIKFKPGDIILDIGAQVGMVSVYLAKQHPGVIIYAFEPVPENYENLVKNLSANGVGNVVPVNCTVAGASGPVTLSTNTGINSGGGSAYTNGDNGEKITSEAITLDEIFSRYEIERCRLLKLDCEGAEYDIMYNAPPETLNKIDYIRGEFHTNKRLRELGYKPAALRRYLRHYVNKTVRTGTCQIAE